MRKKRAPEPANHDRWLISYADFITLLFAFFVVMFASSQSDRTKSEQMSEAFKDAIGKDKITAALAVIMGTMPNPRKEVNAEKKAPVSGQKQSAQKAAAVKYEELAPTLVLLQSRLKPEIASGMLQVSMEDRGLVISLRQAAFFPSGQDAIDSGTYPTIGKLAEVIIALPNKVRLEGHTDAVPIHNARYRSNWELSSARSVTMLELLTTRFHVKEDHLSVGGYAETIPIMSNDTPDGRAQNRRVDVVILNENGLKGEPGGMK